MLAQWHDAPEEAAIDPTTCRDDEEHVEPGGDPPFVERAELEDVSAPAEGLREQQRRATERSAELGSDSDAVHAQGRQAIHRARRLRVQIAQDRELALGPRWVEGFNGRDVEALVGIADPAIELHDAGRLFGRQAHYVGHAGLRRWIAVANATASDVFISLGAVRRERSGAILVIGELVLGRRAVTPLALLLSTRDGAIIAVHAFLSDEATLKRIGRIDP